MPIIEVNGQLKIITEEEFKLYTQGLGTTPAAGGNVVQLNNTQTILSPNTTNNSPGQTLPTSNQNVNPAAVNVGFGTDPAAGVRTSATGTDGVANLDITRAPATVSPNVNPVADVTTTTEREAAARRLSAPENVFDPTGVATEPPAFGFNPDSVEQDEAVAQAATLERARLQNTIANQRRNPNNGDWRVKLQLAPGAEYLYNDPAGAGILAPLRGTGIIFPYTPTIATTYKATYSSYDLTHSNYKGYYYQGSAVEPVTLSCPFTAQSTVEAEYLLAVIHFFKSVTKMFYGRDPQSGTPPPLVYLTGLGEFQFNEHPCVVQSFTYDLPADVDYIRARSQNVNNSNMLYKRQSTNPRGPGTTWGNGILGNFLGGAINRLANAGLPKGGMNIPPSPPSFGLNSPTYVPTKMTIAISLLPVQSRKQQSQNFSLRQYATGDLLKGGFW